MAYNFRNPIQLDGLLERYWFPDAIASKRTCLQFGIPSPAYKMPCAKLANKVS
jgi:hypothetical protein